MNEKAELKSLIKKKRPLDRSHDRPIPSSDRSPLSPRADGGVLHLKPHPRVPRHGESLRRQQDLLHYEIKRGREYLERVQDELDESRASLEHWNRYEMISSTHPLDHLIQTMALQEKTQQFLVDWLKRKQEKLAKLREDGALTEKT